MKGLFGECSVFVVSLFFTARLPFVHYRLFAGRSLPSFCCQNGVGRDSMWVMQFSSVYINLLNPTGYVIHQRV